MDYPHTGSLTQRPNKPPTLNSTNMNIFISAKNLNCGLPCSKKRKSYYWIQWSLIDQHTTLQTYIIKKREIPISNLVVFRFFNGNSVVFDFPKMTLHSYWIPKHDFFLLNLTVKSIHANWDIYGLQIEANLIMFCKLRPQIRATRDKMTPKTLIKPFFF